MTDESAGFRVSDQRHFAADGTPRAAAAEVEAQHAGMADEASTQARDGAPLEVSFSSFIVSLAAQASILLRGEGGSGDEPGSPARDVEGARQLISILEMLQDKTEGRRTADESRLLDGLLFELKMAYVTASQRHSR
jgi:hypothetical protein